MRLGFTEGCDQCMSIQTCIECKCSGQVSAPVNSPGGEILPMDYEHRAEEVRETPADMELKVEEDYVGGLGAATDTIIPYFVTTALGTGLVTLSFALSGAPKEVTRGIGIVLGGLGVGSIIHTFMKA